MELDVARRKGRDPLALAQRQLAALDRWHAQRVSAERAMQLAAQSREQRLDLARRREVMREQHAAIIARTDAQLRASARLLPVAARPTLVVAHRTDWFADRVCQLLAGAELEMVARVDNGAHAVGAAVAEQPDLMLVEDVLPQLTGLDVVRQVLEHSPGTRVVAHAGSTGSVGLLLAAGAAAVYSRQVKPMDVVDGLLRLVPAL